MWTISFIIIFIVSILSRMGMQIQANILPLYVVSLGKTAATAGFISGAYMIMSLAFRPIAGSLIDKYGAKWIMITGLALLGITSAFHVGTTSPEMLLAVRCLVGAAMAVQTTAIATMASDILPENKMLEGISYFGVTPALATAIGPAVALAMLGRFSYDDIFIASVAMIAAGIVPSLSVRSSERRMTGKMPLLDDGGKKEKIPWWGKLVEIHSVPASLVGGIYGIATASVNTFVVLYADSLGIRTETSGAFFTVFAASAFATRIFTGRLVRRFGPTKVLMPVFALMTIMFVLYYFITMPVHLILLSVLTGFCCGVIQPLLNGIAVKTAPIEHRGGANATYLMFNDVGMGIGAILWGYMVEMIGYAGIYLVSAIVNTLALVLYAGLVKKKV